MLDPKTLYAIENILAKKINSAHRTENIGLLEELTEALKKKRESIEKELKTSGKTFEACQTTTIIEKNRKMTKYKCS